MLDHYNHNNMYIICQKHNDEIVCICQALDYMGNGYPRDVYRNTAYVKEMVHVYEDVAIPAGVEEYRYCYTTEKGFYENGNYQESSTDLQSRIEALERENIGLKEAMDALEAGVQAAVGGANE